jgi:hypothetical protein
MVTLRLRFGLDSMPDDTKDKRIAPKISRLAAPAAPDISAERKPLLSAFIFNFNLSLALSNKDRQFIFNVIRKAEDAFDEYCRAVNSLGEYVAARGLKLSPYFSAMRHFEHCVAHVYQAVCCYNALVEPWAGEKQFDRGDGSILERVHIIHTAIKHMDERFERGSLRDESSFALFATGGSKSVADHDAADIANVPMWLTNDGLECAKGMVTYVELAQEIRELCREAENLANITPGKKKATCNEPSG